MSLLPLLFYYFSFLDQTTKGWYINELHFLLTLYLLLSLVKMQFVILTMVLQKSKTEYCTFDGDYNKLASSTVSLFSSLLLCWSLLCKWVSVILCVQTELYNSLWHHTAVDMGPQCQHHTSSLRLEGTLSVTIEKKNLILVMYMEKPFLTWCEIFIGEKFYDQSGK